MFLYNVLYTFMECKLCVMHTTANSKCQYVVPVKITSLIRTYILVSALTGINILNIIDDLELPLVEYLSLQKKKKRYLN